MRSILNTIKRWWVRGFRSGDEPSPPRPPVRVPPMSRQIKLGPADHRREHGRGKR